MLIHHLASGLPEWWFARHHLPERYAQRVQVRADINLDSGKLLD